MKKFLILSFLVCFFKLQAQVISGPLTGYVEHKEAAVWIEVAPTVKKIAIKYWKSGSSVFNTKKYEGKLGQAYNPIKVILENLEMASDYKYCFVVDGKETETNAFKTKTVWEYSKPAPDFSFITGSCAYLNDSIYDRPGKPYGGNPKIFETMADTPSDFMLWLGDNFYTREADHSSKSGFMYRISHDRATRDMQRLWKSRPHYAIWDDHDFGPNDSGKAYRLKTVSRQIFMDYWPNPTFGQNNEGIYTNFTHNDADFFLMDDRYFRSADDMAETVDGKPNPDKKMYGDVQMEWLKNALLSSSAPFKFIVTGSQVLNPNSSKDCLRHYPAEFEALMSFIESNKVEGVLFLTGDRHHSEVIKLERKGAYSLYDITASPLTSGVSGVLNSKEKDNPTRVLGSLVIEQNFAKISITGPKSNRQLNIDFINMDGKKQGGFSVNEKDLK